MSWILPKKQGKAAKKFRERYQNLFQSRSRNMVENDIKYLPQHEKQVGWVTKKIILKCKESLHNNQVIQLFLLILCAV